MQYITREHAGGRMEDTYRYLVSGHASGKRIVTPSRTHGGGNLGYCMQYITKGNYFSFQDCNAAKAARG